MSKHFSSESTIVEKINYNEPLSLLAPKASMFYFVSSIKNLIINCLLFVGSMPVPVNPSWMKPMECAGLKATFLGVCGADTARPTCVCANGDSWLHPYWIGQCAEVGIWSWSCLFSNF